MPWPRNWKNLNILLDCRGNSCSISSRRSHSWVRAACGASLWHQLPHASLLDALHVLLSHSVLVFDDCTVTYSPVSVRSHTWDLFLLCLSSFAAPSVILDTFVCIHSVLSPLSIVYTPPPHERNVAISTLFRGKQLLIIYVCIMRAYRAFLSAPQIMSRLLLVYAFLRVCCM